MATSLQIRLDRIRTCVSDLRDNGIDLQQADEAELREVVEHYLDYFHLMIGYESDIGELIALIKAGREKSEC